MSKEKEETFTSGEKSHGRWPKKKYLYLDKFEKYKEEQAIVNGKLLISDDNLRLGLWRLQLITIIATIVGLCISLFALLG
jgi:hypothetical protein